MTILVDRRSVLSGQRYSAEWEAANRRVLRALSDRAKDANPLAYLHPADYPRLAELCGARIVAAGGRLCVVWSEE